MSNGYQLGKIFGIEITIDPSWIFIFLLVTFNLSIGIFPRLHPEWGQTLNWFISISASILFFASVLAHELAHSLVAKIRGLPIKRITFFLFGGVSNLEKEPESPATEFIMSIVGPLTSILLGILFLLVVGWKIENLQSLVLIPDRFIGQLTPLETLLAWLGPVNIIVGIFNLIPGFPLDGGRILRSFIWSITNNLKTSTRIASFIGQFIGYLFILVGLSMIFGVAVPFFGGGFGTGLWIAFIGWFLKDAASHSYQMVAIKDILNNISVKTIMRKKIFSVPSSFTISQLIDKYIIGKDISSFPVKKDNRIVGMISFEDIQSIPREEWENKKLSQIMKRYAESDAVSPVENISSAFEKLTKKNLDIIPVIKRGVLVGFLTLRDIMLWLKLNSRQFQIGKTL